MNFNFIDFIIIILLFCGGFYGYRKGFIGSIVGFIGSILALVLAVKFYKPFADFLNSKFGLLQGIHGFLVEHLPLPVEVSTAPLSKSGFHLLAYKVYSMALPDFIKEQIVNEAEKLILSANQLGLTTIGEVLIYIIAMTLLNGLALILLWVLLTNLLRILAKILSKTLDNTFLGSINRFGGLIVGTALNILGLTIFLGMFTLFLEVVGQANASVLVAVGKTVNQSVLVPYFIQGYQLLLSKLISLI
ncbi:MAG: CvpA family protein [Peptococcales bacterium]